MDCKKPGMGAFIFDMDGIIIDSEPIHSRTKIATFQHYGISFPEEQLVHYMGRTSRDLFNDVIRDYQRTDLTAELMVHYKHKLYLDILQNDQDIQPVAGVIRLLEALKAAQITVGLASSSGRNVIAIVLKKFGLQDYFQTIVSGADLPKSKPDPAVYLLAAKRLSVLPEHCIVLEDAAAGVAAAKAAGMYCIAYRNPNSGQQELSRADVVVEALSEIDLQEVFSV